MPKDSGDDNKGKDKDKASSKSFNADEVWGKIDDAQKAKTTPTLPSDDEPLLNAENKKGGDVPEDASASLEPADEGDEISDSVSAPEVTVVETINSKTTKSDDGDHDVDDSAEVLHSDVESVITDEFTETVWDVLEHAGVTKKRIVIFLVAFIAFVYFVFSFLFSSGDSSKSTIPDEPVETTAPSTATSAFTLDSSYLIGLEYNKSASAVEHLNPISSFVGMDGVDAVLATGLVVEADDVRFYRYIGLLRDVQNVYNVDIYNLMDISVDRRLALDNHIKLLESLLNDANSSILEINRILENLSVAYNGSLTQKNFAEKQFFQSTQNLLGRNAYSYLHSFVLSSQNYVEQRAYANAYLVVRDMMVNSVSALEPRYRDVVANREALIKGIHVFDIPDSDIDAIIRLDQ